MKKPLFLLLFGLLSAALLIGFAMAAGPTTLIVAQDDSPRMMNPHGDDSDAGLQYAANFFDGLVQRKGADGTLAPALAVRWERLDALTWKFYLRKGVKFHNGNPFTAQDVKFSFERTANPEVSEFVNFGKSLDSVQVIDDYTVVVKTKTPIPWFVNNLHQVFIMDKESTEKRDPGDVMVKPIGTGAYKLEEWVKGSYVKLVANEDYWEGAPPIKHVEIRPITEPSTRFAALASGQVDMLTGVPLELYNQVVADKKLEVVSRPARRSIFLVMGNKPGSPLADLRVRKAIYMAINENEIIQKVMRGHATPAAQIPDPPTVGYNATLKRLAYNPEGAKKLLNEAGYGKGFTVTLTGPTDRYIMDKQICEAVAGYLAKVGITVKLDLKPKSIFFPEVAQGKLEMYLIGWFDGTFDMGRTYTKLVHTRDVDRGFGELNGAQFSDAGLDKLIESSATMLDLKERTKTLQELNKMAMVDKIYCIPLHYQVDIYALQKAKKINFKPRPDRWMVYKELSFAK
jgi:peptide/nickel transport system substrate-binding protein